MTSLPVLPPRHAYAMTPWFTAAAPPARVGVYERQNRLAPYSHWNGRAWGMSSQTIARAAEFGADGLLSLQFDLPWRGLAEEAL